MSVQLPRRPRLIIRQSAPFGGRLLDDSAAAAHEAVLKQALQDAIVAMLEYQARQFDRLLLEDGELDRSVEGG